MIVIQSVTNTRSKIWIGIDILVFAFTLYRFLFVSLDPSLLFIVFVIVLYRIKWRSDKVIINDTEIQIVNWFTTTKTVYELNKIDVYAFNNELILGGRMLLISDNLVVVKIRHKNYSNFNDLLDFLDGKLKDGSSTGIQP